MSQSDPVLSNFPNEKDGLAMPTNQLILFNFDTFDTISEKIVIPLSHQSIIISVIIAEKRRNGWVLLKIGTWLYETSIANVNNSCPSKWLPNTNPGVNRMVVLTSPGAKILYEFDVLLSKRQNDPNPNKCQSMSAVAVSAFHSILDSDSCIGKWE